MPSRVEATTDRAVSGLSNVLRTCDICCETVTCAVMATTMVPSADRLPDVLPTERLLKTGKAVPEVREALRRIPNALNAFSVVFCWVQIIGGIVIAVRLDNPFVWAIEFLLAGRGFALLNILGHEAAHRLLFSKKSVNDFVGRWFLAYPAFTPIVLYRRSHMAHHRDEFGPEEPDNAREFDECRLGKATEVVPTLFRVV